MQESSPSAQEWSALYHAAIDFRKTEPWNWLSDTDLFGVQNPVDGNLGYCCIMGELKEMLGLVVYLGTEGLAGYFKTQSEREPSDVTNFLHEQNCLTLTFEGRKYLRAPDLRVIRDLGLKFRGRQDWPLFRSYRPGYMPWYLTREEVLYLTAIIPQAIEMALRVKGDGGLLVPPRKDRYLLRIPEKTGETLAWRDEWRTPPPVEKKEPAILRLDELRLQRIKKTVSRRQGIWEIDQFYSPAVIDDGGRPYFPHVFLWVDHDSGLALHVRVAEMPDYASDFQEHFMALVEKINVLPDEILLQHDEPLELAEPIASRLGIRVTRVKELPALQKVRTGLFSYFNNK